MIDEILYNSDYVLRHFLGNDRIFDENLKKEVPILDMIQQVFNDVNQQYSWIVVVNQSGYLDGQLDNVKISMDNVFQVIFVKPLHKNTSMEKNT